jgi:hypothetical protein
MLAAMSAMLFAAPDLTIVSIAFFALLFLKEILPRTAQEQKTASIWYQRTEILAANLNYVFAAVFTFFDF